MPKARYSPKAIADFREIRRYISRNNPRRGISFVREIRERCELWAHSPLAGKDRSALMMGLRSFPHGNYVVLYLPEPDGVLIVRVVHAARDLPSLFQ